MKNPRSTSAGSIMPNYPWLYDLNTNVAALPSKIHAMRILGVPMQPEGEDSIKKSVKAQAQTIVDDLAKSGAKVDPNREIVALIAYLQKLGKTEQVTPSALTQ
jgi:cytochrome c oxidase cbb3-type subunit I/II